MYSVNRHVQPVHMGNRTRLLPKAKERPRLFIREWRQSKNLTLEKLAERLREAHGLSITHASLSRIERGVQPYSRAILEALAAELTGGDPASLLMRNPTEPDGIWSLWDKASDGERRMIVELAKTVLKTGT